MVLTVDGKEYAAALIVENDPKADPSAIITYDFRVPGEEDGEDGSRGNDEGVTETKEIVPFIPKSRDD